MKTIPLLLLIALFIAPALHAADDQAASREAKLRDELRSTILQLRDAQNQAAQSQAQLDAANANAKDLQAKLDDAGATIKKQATAAAAAQTAAAKTISDQNDQITSLNKQLADFQAAIVQWKGYQTQAEKMMITLKASNQQLTLQVVDLQRLVADRQSKNLDLYKTGVDILNRYQKYSLGDALEAKEPFLGLTRTKLETLVQDYQDALDQSKSPPPPVKPMKTPLTAMKNPPQ